MTTATTMLNYVICCIKLLLYSLMFNAHIHTAKHTHDVRQWRCCWCRWCPEPEEVDEVTAMSTAENWIMTIAHVRVATSIDALDDSLHNTTHWTCRRLSTLRHYSKRWHSGSSPTSSSLASERTSSHRSSSEEAAAAGARRSRPTNYNSFYESSWSWALSSVHNS